MLLPALMFVYCNFNIKAAISITSIVVLLIGLFREYAYFNKLENYQPPE